MIIIELWPFLKAPKPGGHYLPVLPNIDLIKIASANALFVLFQNVTMLENSNYASCTRFFLQKL